MAFPPDSARTALRTLADRGRPFTAGHFLAQGGHPRTFPLLVERGYIVASGHVLKQATCYRPTDHCRTWLAGGARPDHRCKGCGWWGPRADLVWGECPHCSSDEEAADV